MSNSRKKFVQPDFVKGKTGDEFASDVERIFQTKPDSHSATAITAAIETLWDQKTAQMQTNAQNATGVKKKEVTKEAILASKAGYVARHGERGWLNYVALDFGVDPKTIRKRLEQEK